MARMWYRRNFTLPGNWAAGGGQVAATERVLLHFGAVDWEAEVFLNGHRLGLHRGGYVRPFILSFFS
jgi:beta-galactosidase/beta-glucuronidase